jgi:perosamine synthetase
MFESIVAFIREQYGTEAFIPLHEPRFLGNEKKYLEECIDSTFVSSVGKFVDAFEEQVAAFTGAKRAVATANGTLALHLALILCGVRPETEVLTQPLTFIATANAIAYTGAKPVFLDVDKETLGLSPDALTDFLSRYGEIKNGQCINKVTGNQIVACIPMHTFGHPARIDDIVAICNKYNISVIEDAAESIGSFYKDKHTGTVGKMGVLSFNGNKTITTGGGGMIITNDENLANRAKHLSTQAKVSHPWDFIHDELAFNYRMPNLNASLGLAQLEQLPGFLEQKRSLAKKYNQFFESQSISFFNEPYHAKSNFWLNAILLSDREERDAFLKYTNDHGVMTRPAWTLMNDLPMYQDVFPVEIPVARWLADRLVNIPSSVILQDN